ncbi:HAAS signaling domain-containing protein [Streptomyces sp. NPDC053513]|uniref:HAAS signaling domain-containing protein n=1 Tax=Streptomyces litmocidini TaxID=67318 RepID=A0ABW7UL76_9ACTN
MGIESDQLVYDYLSRVGDLAQQRQLPASDRRKLVSGLRDEIDRRRATHGEESPAAVRDILGDLGTPDEVVERAGPREAPGVSSAAIPAQDRQGPDGAGDWWNTDTDEAGLLGFVGGIERPDLFAPPAPAEEKAEAEAEEAAPGKARRLARILRLRKAPAPAPAAGAPEAGPEAEAAPRGARVRLANPFVLLAALLLLGGAVFGSLIALAAGWLLAYASRRLTPGEIRTAVLVIPGLAAASGIAWIWGRVEGRWGEAVAPGGEAMGAAISETWPWTLRGAAIASSLFLLWRSRKT